MREAIINNVAKILICGSVAMGYRVYQCPTCDYSKFVPFTCKSKSCSSCGKKATDRWISKNYSILPKTLWQNITFTLPSEIWPLFWCNRHLMNLLPKYAADCIKKIAAKKKALPGIFLAVHTFGRDLKRNFHIHAATTCGGLSFNLKSWIKVYFHHQVLKNQWKKHVLNFLQEQFKAGMLSFPKSLSYLEDPKSFNIWIKSLREKKWVVHLAKPTTNHEQNISYLGKYLKRPPLSEANILSYDGNNVILRHLDHNTKTYITIAMTVEIFIGKFISHLHNRYFRSIRYYGWLANRVRTKMLGIVYGALHLPDKTKDIKKPIEKITWLKMQIREFNINPLKCTKCNNYLFFLYAVFKSKLKIFINNHYALIANNV